MSDKNAQRINNSTPLGHNRVFVRGKRWGTGFNRASGTFEMNENYVRFTTFTNNPAEEGITAANGKPLSNMPVFTGFSVRNFVRLLKRVEGLLLTTGPQIITVEDSVPMMVDGKRDYNQNKLRSKLLIGRDADGLYYMMHANRERSGENAIYYIFGDEDDLMAFKDGAEELTKAQNSKEVFEATFETIRILLPDAVSSTFNPNEAKERQERRAQLNHNGYNQRPTMLAGAAQEVAKAMVINEQPANTSDVNATGDFAKDAQGETWE